MTKENPFEQSESQVIRLHIENITKENFKLFGDFVEPCDNMQLYDQNVDAKIDLSTENIRYYTMSIQFRPFEFDHIVRHSQCTEALIRVDGGAMYMVVCPADNSVDVPDMSLVKVFKIPLGCMINLHRGTWHIGPFFDSQEALISNLSHQNTTSDDYQIHNCEHKYAIANCNNQETFWDKTQRYTKELELIGFNYDEASEWLKQNCLDFLRSGDFESIEIKLLRLKQNLKLC
jgi:ureidoglycolate hydrolase